jgi:transposase, IS6 family
VLRWGPCEVPAFDPRCRPYLRATHEASRVDETYSTLNKLWYDRYRAVDATGATLDCRLSATREADAAACCFRPVLQASHTRTPRVSTGDNNAAYPPAFAALQPDSPRPETCRLRPCKYLQNIVEPDHRWVPHRVRPGEGLGACAPAPRTIQGDEARHMLRQGQCKGGIKGAVLAQHRVINQRFGGAASRALAPPLRMVPSVFATLPADVDPR